MIGYLRSFPPPLKQVYFWVANIVNDCLIAIIKHSVIYLQRPISDLPETFRNVLEGVK